LFPENGQTFPLGLKRIDSRHIVFIFENPRQVKNVLEVDIYLILNIVKFNAQNVSILDTQNDLRDSNHWIFGHLDPVQNARNFVLF